MKESLYHKGKLDTISKLIAFVDKEIDKIKSTNAEGTNSPRQISNGGKLRAYNKLKQKLLATINKIIE